MSTFLPKEAPSALFQLIVGTGLEVWKYHKHQFHKVKKKKKKKHARDRVWCESILQRLSIRDRNASFRHSVYAQLTFSRQVVCVNTKWNLLSKCKTLQFDRRTLSDGHDFGELHFNLWLVFAHHACIHRERDTETTACNSKGNFFSAQGSKRSRSVKINTGVRTWLREQCFTTTALGKTIIACWNLSPAKQR